MAINQHINRRNDKNAYEQCYIQICDGNSIKDEHQPFKKKVYMIRYNKIDYFTYILSGSLIKISRLKFFVFQKRNSSQVGQ